MSSFGKTSRTVMRALRVTQFGGPDVLKVDCSVPVPIPAENQVQIEVKAAGLNPVDTYVRAGVYANLPDLPYTPGSDASGVVSDIGPAVTRFKKGDPVYTIKTVTGSCAEYTVVDQAMVGHLGGKLTYEQGAGIGVPYYSAYRALAIKARDKVKPGNSVLIHGASGAVGIACVQLAVARGLKVVGTASSQEGRDLVMKQGAAAIFNHRDDDYAHKIVEATGGEGPDIVIEMLANVNLQRDLEMVRRGGIIVIVGNRGNVEINPRLCMQKECTVTGMLLLGASSAEWEEMHAGISEGMAAGWLQPHIGRQYALEDAHTAHDDVINAGSALGKRIFTI